MQIQPKSHVLLCMIWWSPNIMFCWSTVVLRNMSVSWSQWCASDRILARTSGGDASSQARGHIGDPVLTTHWIPLPSWAQATRITVREERWLLMRQAFHSACDNMKRMHIYYWQLIWKIDQTRSRSAPDMKTETKKGNTKGTLRSALAVIIHCITFLKTWGKCVRTLHTHCMKLWCLPPWSSHSPWLRKKVTGSSPAGRSQRQI